MYETVAKKTARDLGIVRNFTGKRKQGEDNQSMDRQRKTVRHSRKVMPHCVIKFTSLWIGCLYQ